MFKPTTEDDDDENNDVEQPDLTVLPGQGQGLDKAMNEVCPFLLPSFHFFFFFFKSYF
jgi:hypothetical protein